jgi:acyl dehydratase
VTAPAAVRVFASPRDLVGAVGEELGPGPWLTVDQHRIDLFADATGDDQWIHVDPVRSASGPFGATVAHGFLTLSLVPRLARDLFRIEGAGARLNYGLDRVRFPAAVRVGTAVRARARLLRVEPVPGGYHVVMLVTVETDAVLADPAARPACVAESLSRVYLAADEADDAEGAAGEGVR